jgi:cysteine desulfurase
MRTVYLDHSATTPLDPDVLAAMMPFLSGVYGNPSSIHGFGRVARQALEDARRSIASNAGAKADEIVFTSGGTEADNTAVLGAMLAGKKVGKTHLLISAIEHHAVLEPAHALREQGFEVEELPVDQGGLVSPSEVQKGIRPSTALISVMHANNEIGTVQPIRKIADIAHKAGALLHTDAVQSLGKIPFDVAELGLDLASFSAHKMYGPKGIGALYIRKGLSLEPLIRGGSQETNRRGGTESVSLAAGFAKALELCQERMESDAASQESLREDLRVRILATFSDVVFNGNREKALPHILSLSFDGRNGPIDGDALIMGLDLRGIAVTSGSACTSGTLEPSHVLMALGRDEQTARATVRFSVGRSTTTDDIAYAVEALREVYSVARRSPSA